VLAYEVGDEGPVNGEGRVKYVVYEKLPEPDDPGEGEVEDEKAKGYPEEGLDRRLL